jgi:hypothetical protein
MIYKLLTGSSPLSKATTSKILDFMTMELLKFSKDFTHSLESTSNTPFVVSSILEVLLHVSEENTSIFDARFSFEIAALCLEIQSFYGSESIQSLASQLWTSNLTSIATTSDLLEFLVERWKSYILDEKHIGR